MSRLEKTSLQSSTNFTNWEERLQYEPFCKAYFQWYWSTPDRPHNWIVIHLRHGQLRKRETTVWWILDKPMTIITYHKYSFMPPSLQPKNSIFSYWHSHTHCENNQWILRESGGRDLESTVTLEPRTSTQCWPYYFGPEQCSDEKTLLTVHPL